MPKHIIVQQIGHLPRNTEGCCPTFILVKQKNISSWLLKKYPFEQAVDVLKKTETRHARGKQVVIGPAGDDS
ncbi:hypothetical protein F3157_09245 [Virgibacillus dakarensis]|nr:hypothetical protein [Virgibacillus dakarensis]